MNTLQQSALDILGLFNNEHVLDEPERGAGFHIFFDLRNHYHPRLNFDENMDLFYHYKSFEKCLGLMRKRELHTSELCFREIEQLGQDYPPYLENGMVSLYYAMAAYREYAFKRYDNAIAKLRIAIKHAELQGEDYPVFLCEIAEQWLNVVRVHIRRRDEQLIVEETVQILAFLFTGMYEDPAVGKRYLQLEQKEHNQALIHVINSVYMGLDRMTGGDMTQLHAIYRQIFSKLAPMLQRLTVNEFMAASIQMMQMYYEGRYADFLEELRIGFSAVRNTTRSMQKLLFDAFLDICRQQDVNTVLHPNFGIFSTLMNRHFAIKIGEKETANELSSLSAVRV